MQTSKEMTPKYYKQNLGIKPSPVFSQKKVLLQHVCKLVAMILVTQLISVQASPFDATDNEAVNQRNLIDLRFRRATACSVSEDQLITLRNQVNTDLRKLGNGQHGDRLSDDSSKDSNNCESLVNLVKNGVDIIKKSFLTEIINGTKQNNLKHIIRSLAVKYYENGIHPVKDSLSQHYQQKLYTLMGGLKMLEELVSEFENKQNLEIINPCSKEAKDGSDCCVNLSDYESTSGLADFVQRAYNNFGKQNNIESIMQFAFGLPWLSQRSVVYKKLFEEMGKHGDLGNPEIVMLANKVEETINQYANSSCETSVGPEAALETKTALQALKNNITFYSNKLMESWTSGVSNSNYESLDKLEKILLLMENINNLEDRAVGYNSLLEAIKSNNHLDNYHTLTLAFGVRESMEIANKRSDSHSAKDKLARIKSNLPQSISSLIWSNKSCKIKSRKNQETFYAAVNDFNHDADRRKVFTWIPTDAPNADWKFTWRFESKDNGRNFRIKNPKFNDEYLFASLDKKDPDRRWVFTWIPKEKKDEEYWKKWRLVPTDNGKYFRLLNMQFGEYLYAESNMTYGHDNDRRGVFLWVQDNSKTSIEEKDSFASHWEITC